MSTAATSFDAAAIGRLPLDEALAACRDLLEDPDFPTVHAWKESGGRVLGHFQVYFPEELAHAAGELVDDALLPGLELAHVDGDLAADHEAELARVAQLVEALGGGDQGLDELRQMSRVHARSTTDGFGDELVAALHALKPEFRAAVELVDLHDLSYQDAAERLSCPVGTVMSRLHRGRKRLQGSLEEYAREQGVLRPAA